MSAGIPGAMDASPLVDVTWLKSHLGDVVVLDASIDRVADAAGGVAFRPGHAVFTRGHIPGAQFADLFSAFSDPDGEFPFTQPTVPGLEAAARAVGLTTSSTVVIYDNLGGAWAARLWWVLRANGFDSARVLNGGFGGWVAAGGAIELGKAAPVTPGDFVALPRPGYFVGKDDVRALTERQDPARPLVCGLRQVQFTGKGSDDPRAGHIPGSISLPYHALLDSDGLLDLQVVADYFDSKGLRGDAAPVLYCGGGINAAGLALALTAIGHDDLTIYDGSLNEWKADPSLPLVRGDA